MTAILGLNAYHGDAAAALVVDGELVAAAEEERFNRVKHVRRLPGARRPLVPREAGLDPGASRPPCRLPRPARERRPEAPPDDPSRRKRALPQGATRRMPRRSATSGRRLRLARHRAATLRAQVHNVEHHQAHVATAFFVSPFDEAAILSVDGFGDFCSTMTAVGRGNASRCSTACCSPTRSGSSTPRSRSGSASPSTATRAR